MNALCIRPHASLHYYIFEPSKITVVFHDNTVVSLKVKHLQNAFCRTIALFYPQLTKQNTLKLTWHLHIGTDQTPTVPAS